MKKLTLQEMADVLNITPKTLKKYVEEYDLPCLKIGRSLRFDAAQVEKSLKKAQSEPMQIPVGSPRKTINLKKQNPDRERFRRALGLS